MENFIKVKEKIVKQAIKKNACKRGVERAKNCESWEQLKVLIIDNFWWCIDNDIELPDGHYKSTIHEFTIVNGKLHGEYKLWYINSKLWVHCTYKEGKRDVEYKSWYENGKLEAHRFYKEGQIIETVV
jgi:hypothetical protein